MLPTVIDGADEHAAGTEAGGASCEFELFG
jgi:hypothetical protein